MTPKKWLVAFLLLFVISWPSFVDAGQGCCSYHGGQSYCDTSVGRWVCADGSYSPSCGCTYIPPKATTKPSTPSKSVSATVAPKEDLKQKEIDDLKLQNKELSSKLEASETHYSNAVEIFKELEKASVIWLTILAALAVSALYIPSPAEKTKENENGGATFAWILIGAFLYSIFTGFHSLGIILSTYWDILGQLFE